MEHKHEFEIDGGPCSNSAQPVLIEDIDGFIKTHGEEKLLNILDGHEQ